MTNINNGIEYRFNLFILINLFFFFVNAYAFRVKLFMFNNILCLKRNL